MTRSTIPGQSISRRWYRGPPRAIWVAIIVAWAVAIFILLVSLDVLIFPSTHELLFENYGSSDPSSTSRARSVGWAAAAVLLGATAAWLLSAQRSARAAFLFVVTCVAIPNIWEGLLIWANGHQAGSGQGTSTAWDFSSAVAISMPIRWALWLVVSYVCVIGGRARHFFADGHRH